MRHNTSFTVSNVTHPLTRGYSFFADTAVTQCFYQHLQIS